MLIIIALPRTGSSALFEACAMHPDAHGIFEPFRAPAAVWNGTPGLYYERGQREGNERLLAEICAHYNLAKMVLGEMQPTFSFCRRWSRMPGVRTVALTRDNLLKQAVSVRMSEQSRIWQPWARGGVVTEPVRKLNPAAAKLHQGYTFEPLRVGSVSWYMQQMHRKRLSLVRRTARDPNVLQLTYEEIFDAHAPEQTLDVIELVLDHGGFDGSLVHAEPMRSRVLELLATSRMNSEATYRRVPDIESIERELGSERYGYLFR